MLICKTPLRVSFFGGGSDFENFYKDHGGAVLSSSINKYIYLSLVKKFDERLRISYSRLENPQKIEDIKNPLIKEALRHFNIDNGIELNSISDIPASTGLGSSSAFMVSLCNILSNYKSKKIKPEKLAELAAKLEIINCNQQIGKQDHYAASFGGFNLINFGKKIEVKKLNINNAILKKLEKNLIYIYTNMHHNSYKILKIQNRNNTKLSKIKILKEMSQLAKISASNLINGNLNDFVRALDLGWKMKKELNSKSTNFKIDEIYQESMRLGAKGGKILGAGNGGFLMIYASHQVQNIIKKKFQKLRFFKFKFTKFGSQLFEI